MPKDPKPKNKPSPSYSRDEEVERMHSLLDRIAIAMEEQAKSSQKLVDLQEKALDKMQATLDRTEKALQDSQG